MAGVAWSVADLGLTGPAPGSRHSLPTPGHQGGLCEVVSSQVAAGDSGDWLHRSPSLSPLSLSPLSPLSIPAAATSHPSQAAAALLTQPRPTSGCPK